MAENRKWSYCMATFFGGASYSVAGMRFPRNFPKRVSSLRIRRSLEGVKGFHIQDFYSESSPMKEVQKELEKDTSKLKTTKRKKTVKRVKKEGE